MNTETYYLCTDTGTVYFNVIGNVVTYAGQKTNVTPPLLDEFLAIARELGLKTGKI